MPQSFYEVAWIFIIYAIIGWCTEVSYATLETGKFVNRGFLNGPYCPIYGCGVLLVIIILTPLKENLLILYIGSFLLTSVIEFITGYILEKIFHNKWWDYSDKPYNIKGYVCLKFSVLWGLACTFIMLILHPIIYRMIKIIPFMIGLVILCIIIVMFIIDCEITVATILKFNQRLKILNGIAEKIHDISDEIGENIHENVTEVLDKRDEFIENHGDQIIRITEKTQEVKIGIEVRKIELEKLREQYKSMLKEKNIGHNRLMKAFPKMTSNYYDEILQKLKNYIEMKRRDEADDQRN